MRALTLIYSHRVPGFKVTQIGFDPIQKRNPNPERKAKTRLSVDQPVDRPMSTVDRTQTESSAMSVGQPVGRQLLATVDRANPVHVVHTGGPGGRPASSTGRPCCRLGANLACFNAPSWSFDFRSLCYLLPSPLSPLSLQDDPQREGPSPDPLRKEPTPALVKKRELYFSPTFMQDVLLLTNSLRV